MQNQKFRCNLRKKSLLMPAMMPTYLHNPFSPPLKVLSGVDYGYDANGNLIYDRHRRITSIDYNAIDRPGQIRFEQGDTISYVYTAAGEKLAEISRSADGLSDLRRDYYGPFEFINDSHSRTNYPQGYMDSYGWMYVNVPDYQGNIIGVYNVATGWLDQFTDYYPYGQPHPDCAAPEFNRRKFGAKELITTFGLNEYDVIARRLTGLGQFSQPDPLATLTLDISPYAYCYADPINFIDPFGLFSSKGEAERELHHLYPGYEYDPNSGDDYPIHQAENGDWYIALDPLGNPYSRGLVLYRYFGRKNNYSMQSTFILVNHGLGFGSTSNPLQMAAISSDGSSSLFFDKARFESQ